MVARRAGAVRLRRRRGVPAVLEGLLDGGVRRLLGVHQALLGFRSDALVFHLTATRNIFCCRFCSTLLLAAINILMIEFAHWQLRELVLQIAGVADRVPEER